MIRLLALDLDGTLVGTELTISPRVKRAVAAALEHGVSVTLATGRMFDVALPFARELGISAPLICYQGALIQASDALAPLHLTCMDRAVVREVLEWQVSRGWHIVVYAAREVFAARRVSRGGAASTSDAYPAVFHDILSRERLTWVDGNLSAVLEQHEPVKFIAIGEPDVIDGIEAEWRKSLAGRVEVTRSHRCVVEGGQPEVSKGRALRHLAARLSIPQSQTMAIGDWDNDVDMVAWAGFGVAMGEATPALRAVADWIAPPVAQDGAAVAIEKFVLTAVPDAAV